MKFSTNKNNSSFTLIELLVVLALVAILSVVVVMTLNPAELIKQARDSNRLSDLSTINTALNLFSADVTSGFMGTSTVVYVSIPDNASSTCGSLGLPTLPSGWNYNCVTATNLRNTDGTGWIPVNFQRISSNSPISQLPVDPTNTTTTGNYYTYVTGGSWKVMATPESQKYTVTAGTDGGSNIGQFEAGNNMSLAPFTDGLIGWWKFDESVATVAGDSSGWGNTGTASGTTIAIGKVGTYSRSFNGTSDSISISQIQLGNGSWTASMWMKTAVSNGIAISNSSGGSVSNGMAVWEDKINYRSYYSGWNYNSGTSVVNNNEWHLLTWVNLGNSTMNLYVDGVLENGGFSSLTSNGGPINLIGSGLGSTFNGPIDDIRVYSRSLSSAEVLALYNATK